MLGVCFSEEVVVDGVGERVVGVVGVRGAGSCVIIGWVVLTTLLTALANMKDWH